MPESEVRYSSVPTEPPNATPSRNLALAPFQWVAWLPPVAVLLFCLSLQSAGLTAGTRTYVQWMDRLHQNASAAHAPLELSDAWPWKSHKAHHSLSILACVLPFIWAVLVVLLRDLRLWTRTLLAASLLAALKGFLAWATIVPDSLGWDGCKERLGAVGLDYYRGQDSGTDGGAFWLLDGPLSLLTGGQSWHQRQCADMVFSSPCFFLTVFSCSTYDALRSRLFERREWPRRCCLATRCFVSVLLAAIVAADACLDLAAREHYVADIVIALVLSLLIYSDPAVAVSANHWYMVWSPPPPQAITNTQLDEDSQSQAPCSAWRQLFDEEQHGSKRRDMGRVTGPLCSLALFLSEDPRKDKDRMAPSSRGAFHLHSQPPQEDMQEHWRNRIRKLRDSEFIQEHKLGSGHAKEQLRVRTNSLKDQLFEHLFDWQRERRAWDEEMYENLKAEVVELEREMDESCKRRLEEAEQEHRALLESDPAVRRLQEEAAQLREQRAVAEAQGAEAAAEIEHLSARLCGRNIVLRCAWRLYGEESLREALRGTGVHSDALTSLGFLSAQLLCRQVPVAGPERLSRQVWKADKFRSSPVTGDSQPHALSPRPSEAPAAMQARQTSPTEAAEAPGEATEACRPQPPRLLDALFQRANSPEERTCECGNLLMPDSQFCRMCGKKWGQASPQRLRPVVELFEQPTGKCATCDGKRWCHEPRSDSLLPRYFACPDCAPEDDESVSGTPKFPVPSRLGPDGRDSCAVADAPEAGRSLASVQEVPLCESEASSKAPDNASTAVPDSETLSTTPSTGPGVNAAPTPRVPASEGSPQVPPIAPVPGTAAEPDTAAGGLPSPAPVAALGAQAADGAAAVGARVDADDVYFQVRGPASASVSCEWAWAGASTWHAVGVAARHAAGVWEIGPVQRELAAELRIAIDGRRLRTTVEDALAAGGSATSESPRS